MRFTYCPKCSHALSKSDVEGVPRVHCPHPGCGFVHYDNPTPVVAAIVQRDDDVILIQNKGWPGTWFGLVSGFLERKEDPAVAVLREVDEELGNSITPARLSRLHERIVGSNAATQAPQGGRSGAGARAACGSRATTSPAPWRRPPPQRPRAPQVSPEAKAAPHGSRARCSG